MKFREFIAGGIKKILYEETSGANGGAYTITRASDALGRVEKDPASPESLHDVVAMDDENIQMSMIPNDRKSRHRASSAAPREKAMRRRKRL
ncbi:hypothetical protein TSAR_002737 [Trichomalopsis sarcophagae]|uniref:Uncharacterized protein n=1 Tax=Trichomalopsis sarcophagae TaxID=543379 RepID=A0A232F2P6_9HYME|nr:hypothetical protein TSAR_002737 [Trichomalopsis sarcophagae]